MANSRELDSTMGALDAGRGKPSGFAGRLLNRSAPMRRYSLIGYWGLIFGLTHWPDIKDFPHPSWLFPHVDWVVHASMYGGWAAMWLWVLAGPAVRLPSGLSTRLLAGALAYAILDELTQPPFGRTAEIGDVVADMTGVTVVLLLVGWWLRRQKLRKVG